MALLETAETFPTSHVHEAAHSRFFYETDGYVFEDLTSLQSVVAQQRADILAYSAKPEVHTEPGEVIQKSNLAELDTTLFELDAKIGQHDGWVTMILPPLSHPSPDQKALLADYHVTDDEQGRTVLFVPTTAITAHRTNPHFYDTGHDTHPVIDLRVKTSSDPAPVHNRFTDSVQECSGRWVQFALDQVELGLLHDRAPILQG